MVNRTANPIPLVRVSDEAAFALHTNARYRAYLGDGNGNFEVASNGTNTAHYGRVWIRFPQGVDDNGDTRYSQAISVLNEADIVYKNNLPLKVRLDGTTGEYIITEIDLRAANRSGYNTLVLNRNNSRRGRIHLRQIVEGNVFAVSTASVDSTKVTVEPIIFDFDGTLVSGGKTVSDNIDLSSYIPAAGLERLVLLGLNVADNTVEIVSSSTRTITATPYALSDIQALRVQFSDYVAPLRAVRLSNNASTVKESDLHVDVRQFLNIQQPKGFLNPITRHYRVISGYQESTFGKIYITTGKLDIDGKLILRA